MFGRRLIAALAGAIVLIALQLASGSAYAHNGHEHRGPAAHHAGAAAAHATSTGHLRAPMAQVTAATAEAPNAANVVAEVASSPLDRDGGAGAVAPCGGTCCTSGFSCCAAAAPVALMTAIVPLGSGAAILADGGSRTFGLDPEILPKPPKSFA